MATEKRLIDANALLEKVQFRMAIDNKNAEIIAGCVDITRRLIENATTVDAVEVVRCKDCIHFDERFRHDGEGTGTVYCGGYCYHWDYELGMSPNQADGDDYCSYGERRSNVN